MQRSRDRVTSPTFALFATLRGVAKPIPSHRRTPHVATRWPTLRVPKWQRQTGRTYIVVNRSD